MLDQYWVHIYYIQSQRRSAQGIRVFFQKFGRPKYDDPTNPHLAKQYRATVECFHLDMLLSVGQEWGLILTMTELQMKLHW